jgi:threonine/homoserine/homoserine lactone efflux protein
VSLSNPYFTGWWATVGSGQMGALRLTQPSRLLGFFVGHEMGDVVWYVFVSILLVAGRNWLSGGVYHALLLGCGWLILGLGVLFAVIAMRLMLKSAGDGVPTPFRESGTVGEGV